MKFDATAAMRALISPVGCALVSYVVFLVSIFLPPSLYKHYLHEENFMFLNIKVFGFVTLCVAAFIAGVKLTGRLARFKLRPVDREKYEGLLPVLTSATLVLTSGLSLISVFALIGQSTNLIQLLSSGQGFAAKQALNTEGTFTEALPVLAGAIWWAKCRYDVRSFWTPALWQLTNILIWIGVVVVVFTAIVKVARFDLIPFMIGGFVAVVRSPIAQGKLKSGHFLLATVVAPLSVLVTFGVFSLIRGIGRSDDQIATLLGYGPASINRLALLLNGGLKYYYGGTGTYAFGFLAHIPILNSFIDTGSFFGLPDRYVVFKSEFGAMAFADMNPSYIWPTAFGYFYADLGWLVLPYVFVTGVLTQLAWKSWGNGGTIGLIMYPFLVGTVILWSAANFITEPRFMSLLGLSFAISFVEWRVKTRRIGVRGPRAALHAIRQLR